MRTILTYLALVILMTTEGFAINRSTTKRILVIYSYDATFHAYQKSEKALRDVFSPKDYLIDIEFLDSKRYPERQLNQNVYDRIQIKQHGQSHYDLVIACNDNALNFCIAHQQALFFQTPIIFWGANDLEVAFAQDQNEWISGIAENIALENTLDLIKHLHPENLTLQVITDQTTTGLADYKVFKQKISGFPNFNYKTTDVSNLTLSELTQQLNQFPKQDIILLLSAFRLKNTYLGLDQIIDLLIRNTDNPIYNAYDKGIGKGYLAGTEVNYYDNMYAACLMAKQVLTGTSPKHLNVLMNVAPENVADYKQLQKYNIDLSQVPERVKLVNQPRREIAIGRIDLIKIVAFVAFLFVLLFLIIYLIEAKRKREKHYRVFAENYLNIFNENHSMMLLIDSHTQRITDGNKAAAKFYGYSQDKLKSLLFSNLCLLPQIDIDAFFTQSQKQNSHFEQKHQTQEGHIKDVELHSGKIIIDKQSYIYAIIHDISKRIQAEHQLLEAKKRAEESDRLKSAFLANMSHEIRTPMNSILGFSSLLEEQDIDHHMRKEFIRHIQNSGEHLLTLINDIIDLSKIEANQLKISKGNCDLNQLLDDIFVLFQNQINNSEKQHIKLSLKKGISTPNFIVKTDAIRLKQIFINLLSNALKFTDQGNIEFGYKYREDSVVQFFVKDTGIGIPQNKQKDIFSAFQQIEEYASRNHGGTGLGLSITRSLVEKLGGHIWVMSTPGEGARFYFTHPGESNRLEL